MQRIVSHEAGNENVGDGTRTAQGALRLKGPGDALEEGLLEDPHGEDAQQQQGKSNCGGYTYSNG